jgi:argininosuccinate synthase
MNKIILIYSGGLDTTVCIPLLKEKYGFKDIITVTVDVGQSQKEIKSAEKKAKKLNCSHFTIYAQHDFVQKYIFSAIKSNALYEGYPVSTSLARPLIVEKVVEVAKKLKINNFAHGCTGKGNDQFRIETTLNMLLPSCKIIAPMRELNLTRSEEIKYAREKNLPVSQTKEKIYSIDENLWGRSIEGGDLEKEDFIPPEDIYLWTKVKKNLPVYKDILIEFKEGIPVSVNPIRPSISYSVNNKKMDGVKLIKYLNKIAGKYGIGRIDIMEDRILGLKVRENYECPAATVLISAHKDLESLVLTKEEIDFKEILDKKWAELAYYGLLFHPLRFSFDAAINKMQQRVTGKVKVRLTKGKATVIGRESKFFLSDVSLSSFDTKDFDQRQSEAIVKNFAFQSKLFWKKWEKIKKKN